MAGWRWSWTSSTRGGPSTSTSASSSTLTWTLASWTVATPLGRRRWSHMCPPSRNTAPSTPGSAVTSQPCGFHKVPMLTVLFPQVLTHLTNHPTLTAYLKTEWKEE